MRFQCLWETSEMRMKELFPEICSVVDVIALKVCASDYDRLEGDDRVFLMRWLPIDDQVLLLLDGEGCLPLRSSHLTGSWQMDLGYHCIF